MDRDDIFMISSNQRLVLSIADVTDREQTEQQLRAAARELYRHRHHLEEKEHSGMIVFQHPTLAARDAYAARGGWHALRSATAVTYHRAYGEVGRSTASPDMLLAA
mgnify:CR=1 FL=1